MGITINDICEDFVKLKASGVKNICVKTTNFRQ